MKKLLVFAAAVLMAAPAFAAVQNVKISGDIDSSYVNRQNFALGQRNGFGASLNLVNQSIFLTQTRLRVDADLSDNVSTTVRLLNERVWGTDPSNTAPANDGINLDLAYVTLREFLYSPLTVTIGRQEFIYGNGLILGGNGPNYGTAGQLNGIASDLTKQASNDGIKAVFDYKPLTIDLIYYKSSVGNVTGVNGANKDDVDVFGTNANYQLGDAMNTVIEGYVFSRIGHDNGVIGTVPPGLTHRGDTLIVPGLRVSTNPVKGLNTQAEIAWQGGNKVTTASGIDTNQRRQAMAVQVMASYAVPVAEIEKYKPTVNASFTHVSGDHNNNATRSTTFPPASGERYTAWDSFAEGQNGGTIYNSLFDLSNMNIWTVGGSISPIQDVTATFTWTGLSLDKKLNDSDTIAFKQPTTASPGDISPAESMTSKKGLGNEYDATVNYAYTEDVTFGLNFGWFVPGKTFSTANDSVASQAIAHVNVNF